jgi:polyhydroxyalkanoate synthesis regulator phasin
VTGTESGPEPPANVAALVEALDQRARQAGSEGATTVLRGILGSVAEVLGRIEERLAGVEERLAEAQPDSAGPHLSEQVQAGLAAFNARLGRLEEAFVKAVEDNGSGTDSVVERIRAVVEDALQQSQETAAAHATGGVDRELGSTVSELAPAVSELAPAVSELAPAVSELRAQLAQLQASPGSTAPAPPAAVPEGIADAVEEILEELRSLRASLERRGEAADRHEGVGDELVEDLRRETIEIKEALRTQQGSFEEAMRRQREAATDLRSSVEALRDDVDALGRKVDASDVRPRPRRRLVPLLALVVVLGAIGFTLLPFSAAGAVDCDPPLLVANPDIRQTAGYRRPELACVPPGNTRLIVSALVAFLAVAVGTAGALVPPAPRRVPEHRRGKGAEPAERLEQGTPSPAAKSGLPASGR